MSTEVASAVRRAGGTAGLIVAVGGVGLLLVTLSAAVTIGPANISVGEVWNAVAHHLGLADSATTLIRDRIIWELRVPRALLAATVGAGLALCGAILQSLTRNALADPYLLGISSGASVGAVLVLVVGIGFTTMALPLGAFAGAMLAFLAVLALAGRSLTGDPSRIVLAGVAATYLFSALSSFLIIWLADPNATRGVLYWLLGSLSAANWTDVMICATVLAAALVVCFIHANALDAFAFGGDAAASLGVSVGRVRFTLYVATAALTAVMVAFSGAIGFIGLVIPHAVRLIVGAGHHLLLPASALAGAIFTVLVDTIARTAFAPRELPVGVITALIGVPAFAAILHRRMRK